MDDREIEAEIRRLGALGRDEPEFFGPVPDQAIEAAERELGVRFPRSYRVFLRRLGAAYMVHQEFYGLPFPPPPGEDINLSNFYDYKDVVKSTKYLWEGDAGHGLPRNFINVSSDGCGYYYHIDVSRRDDRDKCPVVVMGPGAPGVVAADDYLEFVRKIALDEPLF